MTALTRVRLWQLQVIATVAFATTTASAVEVLPLEVLPNPYPAPSSVSATISGGLIGSDDAASALSGEGVIELASADAPFGSARITELSVVLDDGGSFSLAGGLLQASAEPGMTRVTLSEPGPAGVVTDGSFDQLNNFFEFEGQITLNDEVMDLSMMDIDPVEADLVGIQLTDNGSQIELAGSFDLQFEAIVSLDILPVEIPLSIDVAGTVLGVATKRLPAGDLDGNGMLDAADIDQLSKAVRDGSTDSLYDLNDDQEVDSKDRRVWVEELKYTYFGDSNLDGEFNTTDFIQVFALGLYEDGIPENAGWHEGDWNGNADFESGDFVMAFQAAGYEKGPRPPRPEVVPEPSGCSIALMALIGLGLRVRRKRNH